MSIFLLRHIKTAYNENRVITGALDVDVLPNQSIFGENPIPIFDRILCSPLGRCRKTLALLPLESRQNITFVDALSERSLGRLEGMEKENAFVLYPELFRGEKIDIHAAIPGGESIDDVKNRLCVEVIPLLNKKNENILICSHNQTLKVLYALLHQLPITNSFWESTNFENGRIYRIF